MRGPFDDFLAQCASDCVNARLSPSPIPPYDPIEEAHDEALDLCPSCGSAAVVWSGALTRGPELFHCQDCAAYGHARVVEGHK